MIARSLDEALAPITDGCMLAVPREVSGVAMAATRALIRRGVRKLHLIALPTSSLQADLLIGAGCVETIETSAVSLGEFGPAPRFTAAVTSGAIRVKDATCPALHAAFQAAEKGVPFMPLRGLIGSDVLAHRNDWKVVDNPFGHDDPIVLLPAIKPDVALFHAPLADREGNIWIGRDRELATMAHAAAKTMVTVEKLLRGKPVRRSRARSRRARRVLRARDRRGAERRLAARACRPLRRGCGAPRRLCAHGCKQRRICRLSRPARACPARRLTLCTPSATRS
jgi:glutaconate CoA-transferase, subunit A